MGRYVRERERERGIEEERWRVCVYKRESSGERRRERGKGCGKGGAERCIFEM